MRNSLRPVLTLAAACAILSTLLTTSVSVKARDRRLPFKAHLVSTSQVGPGRCPVLTVNIQGSGRANHLDLVTLAQSHCISPPDPAFTDGEYTFTNLHGEELRGTYSGHLEPTATQTAEHQVFIIVGQFTITGGTGRFANASGGGDARGITDLVTGEASLFLDGTIFIHRGAGD